MGAAARYVRSASENGRAVVHYVADGGERVLVVVSASPVVVDAAIHRHALSLELLALRSKEPDPRAYWARATARLRQERGMTTAQKYALKRRALGGALRDAKDPRQLWLALSGSG